MQNPICISTGCIHLLTDDGNERISKIREFSPSGIEISYGSPKSLSNFVINKENLEYLQTLRFNSVHAPWKEITYGDNERSKDTLSIIEKLYKQINARNVVFHKYHSDNLDLIQNYDFVASIENGDSKAKNTHTNNVEGIEEILNENKNLKFTFDFAHALTISFDHIQIYLNKFKDRLIEIHLSALDGESKGHQFLHSYGKGEVRTLLNHLKNTDVPAVLEGVVSENNKVQCIKNEIEYIRNI